MLKFFLRFVSKWLRFGLFYHHHYHLYHGLSSAKCLPVWLRTLLRTFHSLFHFAHHSHFANKVDEKWQFLSWINCDIQATKSIFEFVSVEKNSVTITKMNMGVRPKFCGLKTFGVPSTFQWIMSNLVMFSNILQLQGAVNVCYMQFQIVALWRIRNCQTWRFLHFLWNGVWNLFYFSRSINIPRSLSEFENAEVQLW